jgi:pre-rRNA-processing protein TSR4
MEPMDEDGGGGGELKDTFESELDKAFMKFSTRLAHNPEQVLRYEFRGSPLLYSHVDAVGRRLHAHSDSNGNARITTVGGGSSAGVNMPRCEYCGSERVFELQLVPHAISMLEEGREGVGLGKEDAGMEWGTIILGVCARDCAPLTLGQTGWREEWAGVQWEETK